MERDAPHDSRSGVLANGALSLALLAACGLACLARGADNVEAARNRTSVRGVAQAPTVGKARKGGLGEPAAAVTPEREAAVMKFVEQHHPELAALLDSLKSRNSNEYQRAVRDLFRVSERLAQFFGRDPQRYELELRLWQSQSRMDLLAARLKMSASQELQTQLQQSLDEHFSLRQSLLRLERDRAADRLRKLDEQLQTLDASRDELLDRQLKQLVGKPKQPPKTKGTSAAGSTKVKPK